MKISFITFLWLLSSCTMHSIPDQIDPGVELPEAFSSNDSGTQKIAQNWWTDFNDPVLTGVINQVRKENLDLRQAKARLAQARTMTTQAQSALFPQVQLEGSYRKSQSSMFFGSDLPVGDQGVVKIESTSSPISLGAVYELDVWGRNRSNLSAANLGYESATLDLKALEMTITAQIVELWFMITEVKNQRSLLDQQIQANQTMLDLVELRYTRGLASALDVHQQKVQLQGLEAQVPLSAAREKILEHQLALHMGKAPGAIQVPRDMKLPVLEDFDALYVPSQILLLRPDVRASELRVKAAHAQVAAAIADRFPKISLAGSYGVPGHQGRPLFENWVWNLVGNVVAPVFDGGRRGAEVDRQRAIVEERVSAFSKTVLTALQEVEDALISAKSQELHIVKLQNQLKTAHLSLEEAKRRYTGGLIDYLPVLSALQSVQQLERMMISAKRVQISYRIQLYRALGGGTLSPPSDPLTSSQSTPEQRENRT